ncbi:MAG: chitobiase/beta-hexosaminidase C-terminal domain-containing protein [Chitinophaga sp.]|uniref:FN3 associated domain-containing protein n=1 Tax=Chitinophaga sp. TaxID=1869181 RepID=UPI001B2ABF6C|nr:FN3 associated domain-containing protein [Chitinophaga sp.]MBO9730153.1 chitobiase/beta-hexosaminidase C-terminal domain-containing protein [Chitinophaga sp.]
MILKQRFRWQAAGSNLLFAANIFILFLLVFSSQVVLPPWLQVLGRMHPLLLHFPIVLLLVAAILTFIRLREPAAEAWKQQFTAALLLTGALSAVVTVIMGLFLSKEEGYNGSGILQWHKWSGVGICWVASALYWLGQSATPRLRLQQAGVVITVLLLVITGHLGADITHGENFVMAPVTPAGKKGAVPFDQALVYEHLVKPILEEKCMNCHNAGKAKGELAMDLPQQLLKGGKSGKLFVAGKPEVSLLLERLHMPLDAKKHMPPAGKPQLTDEEVALLYYWVKGGADFKAKVAALPAHDSLRLLAATMLQPEEKKEPVHDFSAADEKLVEKLNNNYRVIYPIALHAAPLVVNCYNKDQFNSKAIEELLPLKKQIIEMHLQKMPVQDADLKTISQFQQLRTLNLSFTNLKGKTLDALASLPHLESLSLSGTPVTMAELQALKKAPALKELYLWNTALTAADLQQVQSAFKQVAVIKGFMDEGNLLKLNQPQLMNTAMIFRDHIQLLLKHPIRGAEIRYTTDGSAPDSTQSPVFKDSLLIDKNTTIRAIACKKGWYASEPVTYSFYKSSYIPDSILLVTQPHSSYPGIGPKTLIDLQKGGVEHGNGKWLGYNGKPMEVVMLFKKPVPVQQVAVGSLSNVGAYIFPPAKIEVWGGVDAQHLKLLKRVMPVAGKKDDPVTALDIDCSFPLTSLSCIKVIMTPIPKLPDWHPGKGNPGWVFADEIRFN